MYTTLRGTSYQPIALPTDTLTAFPNLTINKIANIQNFKKRRCTHHPLAATAITSLNDITVTTNHGARFDFPHRGKTTLLCSSRREDANAQSRFTFLHRLERNSVTPIISRSIPRSFISPYIPDNNHTLLTDRCNRMLARACCWFYAVEACRQRCNEGKVYT